MIHKNVGADQCTNMLMKLEEDAEVAYNEYDKAVKAEDRAEMYVAKVRTFLRFVTSVRSLKRKYSNFVFLEKSYPGWCSTPNCP